MSANSPQELYALALDRFVPARAALVKTLRAQKQRGEASEVAALRKPSVAAWAVNQLVRTQPKAVQSLFEAGDELARAQAQAAAGKGGGDAMRDASQRQRDAVRALVEAAEDRLSSAGQGVSQATMERVGDTLRAAANDPRARQQVAGGCLTRELRFIGLGIGGSAPSVEGQPSANAIPVTSGAEDARAATEDARAAEAERVAARERAAALKAARRTEAEARRGRTRAQKELAAAQARQEEAAASLQEADSLLAAAARQAEDAAAKLTAAQQALTDLDRG